MISRLLLLVSFVTLFGVILSRCELSAMRKCEERFSYSTCVYNLR